MPRGQFNRWMFYVCFLCQACGSGGGNNIASSGDSQSDLFLQVRFLQKGDVEGYHLYFYSAADEIISDSEIDSVECTLASGSEETARICTIFIDPSELGNSSHLRLSAFNSMGEGPLSESFSPNIMQ